MSPLADLAIRSSVILLIGLGAACLLRHRSAALRHAVLASAIAAAAAVGPLGVLLPGWHLPNAAAAPVEQVQSAPAIPAVSIGRTSEDQAAEGGTALLPLVATVWAAGFVAFGAMLLLGLWRLARITARAAPVRDDRWLRAAGQVAAEYGLNRRVRLRQTDAADLLATWAVFRPCILLPAHATGWSDDRVHAVLAHELAHVRRHDWIVQIGAELVRAIYWFNPLLWLACTWLRRESEQASDDAVLELGVAAHDYAGHLVDLARTCRRSGSRWAPAMTMARRSTLEGRIAAMLNPRLDRTVLSRPAVAVTCVLMLALALPVAALRGAQDEPLPLTGTVYDVTGAVLPGVHVTLEGAGQVKWQTRTAADGRFEFSPVQAGRYALEVSMMGFRPLRQDIALERARDWDRAITLQVGELSETVSVQASRVVTGPARPEEPRRVRVGGNIRVPQKVHHVNPTYPVSMREAAREGKVLIDAVIGIDGAVHAARVLSAHVHPDFAAAALDAVREWRFTPTLLNGDPVEVRMTVTVEFGLAD
jgi:TonB family protein